MIFSFIFFLFFLMKWKLKGYLEFMDFPIKTFFLIYQIKSLSIKFK